MVGMSAAGASASLRRWPGARRLLPLALALLLAGQLCAADDSGSSGGEAAGVVCPFEYKRQPMEDIRSGAVRPYLFGGIFAPDRDCVNCKRGGLWAGSFCAFKPSGRDVPFWDNQLCSSSSVEAVINRTLRLDDARLLQMTPCDLWPFFRGRTTWIIGDSMSKDLYKALKCFMVEFTDLTTYHASNNFTAMHLLHSLPGFGEPHCIHLPQNTRICQVHAIQGDLFVQGERTQVGVLPLLQEALAAPTDVFVVNFGLWHGETRQDDYRERLHQIGRFYNQTRPRFPNLFWMETPKQHFDSEDGDYKVEWIGVRKPPFTCQPVKGLGVAADGSLTAEKGNAVAEYVAGGAWRNRMAREVLGAYGVPQVPIYNATATAWEFHRRNLDGQECSHFCHPSMPQLWLWTLKQSFDRYKLRPLDKWEESPRRRRAGCASVLERDEARLGAPKPLELVLQERHKRQGFLGRLLKPQQQLRVQDGVAVAVARVDPRGRPAAGWSRQEQRWRSWPRRFPHDGTLNPWGSLQRLLDGVGGGKQPQDGPQQRQEQQQQQQQPPGNSAGKSD